MPAKAAVFETTYRHYLDRIAGFDYLERADRLGAAVVDHALAIKLYGQTYRLSREGVSGPDDKPVNFAVRVVLCCYVLQCPASVPPAGEWTTYRDFRDAGPLAGYFQANTHKIIETAFAGSPNGLIRTCRRLGAEPFDDGSAFDVSLTFPFLPRIPVLLRFNDRDDVFPAQCAIMFPRSAEAFLDMECMAIGGTLLAGTLTQLLQDQG
jgi:hypothetical protein